MPQHSTVWPPEALDLEALATLALRSAQGPAVSPFDADPWILVRPGAQERLPAGAVEALARWLGRQPCPVIGLGSLEPHAIVASACDLLINDPTDLAPVLDNIREAPLSAMVLVQVLRSSESLTTERALVVESLGFATLQAGPEFARWAQANPPRPQRLPPDAGPAVLIERDGRTLILTLNRPHTRNAISIEMRDALVEALELVVADDAVDHVRIRGNGPCFSAGGAITEFGTAPDAATAHAVRSMQLPSATLLRCRVAIDFELHGACIGAGIEFPAFGTHLRAAPDAYFQLPEIGFGLIPGAGGCVSLPRRIGRQRTALMALSARQVSAQTALQWGLIDEII